MAKKSKCAPLVVSKLRKVDLSDPVALNDAIRMLETRITTDTLFGADKQDMWVSLMAWKALNQIRKKKS